MSQINKRHVFTSYHVYLAEQSTTPVLRYSKTYRTLRLNGLHIEKRQGKFYVNEICEEVLSSKFRSSSIEVGDEVIQLNTVYCEHLGAVTNYVEKNRIKNIQLRSKVNGNCYFEEEVDNPTNVIHEATSFALQNENGNQ